MKRFFEDLWQESPRKCMNCGRFLGKEIKTYFFDHLLEKSKYPELALEKDNIFICCFECHEKKTNGFPAEKHREAIEKAKNKFIKNE